MCVITEQPEKLSETGPVFFRGRTPVTQALPYEWHDTPNLRFLSILGFRDYCRKNMIEIDKAVHITKKRILASLPNLLSQEAVFLISMQSNHKLC